MTTVALPPLPDSVSAEARAQISALMAAEPPRVTPVNPRTEVADVSSPARAKAAESASEGPKADTSAAAANASPPARREPAPLAAESYPWLSDKSLKLPEAKEPLVARFDHTHRCGPP